MPTKINRRKSCEGCYYYRGLGDRRSDMCCHYMIDTGMRRGCSAENCDKKRIEKKPQIKARPIVWDRWKGWD